MAGNDGVSKLKARKDNLVMTSRDLAEQKIQVAKLMNKANDYEERFTEKLDEHDKVLETVTQDIEQHRQKIFEATNKFFGNVYEDDEEMQLNAFLAKVTKELDETEDEKAKIYKKVNDLREWMEKKIAKNSKTLQARMERIQSMEERIKELEDEIKNDIGDERLFS